MARRRRDFDLRDNWWLSAEELLWLQRGESSWRELNAKFLARDYNYKQYPKYDCNDMPYKAGEMVVRYWTPGESDPRSPEYNPSINTDPDSNAYPKIVFRHRDANVVLDDAKLADEVNEQLARSHADNEKWKWWGWEWELTRLRAVNRMKRDFALKRLREVKEVWKSRSEFENELKDLVVSQFVEKKPASQLLDNLEQTMLSPDIQKVRDVLKSMDPGTLREEGPARLVAELKEKILRSVFYEKHKEDTPVVHVLNIHDPEQLRCFTTIVDHDSDGTSPMLFASPAEIKKYVSSGGSGWGMQTNEEVCLQFESKIRIPAANRCESACVLFGEHEQLTLITCEEFQTEWLKYETLNPRAKWLGDARRRRQQWSQIGHVSWTKLGNLWLDAREQEQQNGVRKGLRFQNVVADAYSSHRVWKDHELYKKDPKFYEYLQWLRETNPDL